MKRNRWLTVLFAVLALLSLTSIVMGIHNIFSIGPAIVFIGFIVYNCLPQPVVDGLQKKKWWRVGYKIVTNITLFVSVLCSVCLIIMLFYSMAATVESPRTVMVLGCQVRGENPSLMLQGRLDAAYDYISEHDDAVVIVCGGKGSDESATEAAVMKRYLVDRGIDAQRIYEENQSVKTSENIAFGAELIKENGLSSDVLMVTDWYHQLRANRMATQHGLQVTAKSSFTNIFLVEPMFYREVCAVVKFLIVGS